MRERREYPLREEQAVQRADNYECVQDAAAHVAPATEVWRTTAQHLTLAAAVPVKHNKRALGVVMVTRGDENIDRAIMTVRTDILKIFGVTLAVTVLLSIYLARAIARPVRRLALAAEKLRHGQMQAVGLAGTASLLTREAIPDLTARDDEIGDLSGALRDLTAALAQRIGAIENFAADVAHEIKTSLRSAVETIERVQDQPAARQKLVTVIHDDVNRLDRLITDISQASRLDAELSRDKTKTIDVASFLTTLVDGYRTREPREPVVELAVSGAESLTVLGVPSRLAQVIQNIIDNARSFSTAEAKVLVAVRRTETLAQITVDDSGPGLPPNRLETIFERFYSERPQAEKFGMHSGLGLSIARQIVEAHRGFLRAENRQDETGKVLGARFIISLPLR